MNKFLIIDDDAAVRKHLIRLFQHGILEVQIEVASSASEGIEKLKDSNFDVVFIDYRMPVCDGFELLVQAQTILVDKPSNIVIMLESPDKALRAECLKAGAIEVIDKHDINCSGLLEIVKSVGARQHVLARRNDDNVVPITVAKDSLTQILSRTEFEASIRTTIGLENQRNAAIILVNINNFRSINELFGTEVGDRILQTLAKRLSIFSKDMVSFARVGGDEFAILIDGYENFHFLKKVSDQVLQIINNPIHLREQQIQVSACIGISSYPNDSVNENELYKFAFIALYRAKQLGRNKICLFKHEMQEKVLRRHQIEQAIKQTLKRGSFRMVYQPIYDGKNGALSGAEALIRWPDETPAYFPDEFIPVAEMSGTIAEIGKFVMCTSLSQLALWRKTINPNLSMNVNVSPKQLIDKTFPNFVKQALTKYDLPANSLTLELTETALMDGSENIAEVILELKSIGCNIALDDFGTGFSSISHLLNFPIDIVKIDKSVIPACDNEYKQHAVTKGLVMMLKELGSVIVVEGIETEYQHNIISSLDINKVQGYFYNMPCAPLMFETAFAKQQSETKQVFGAS